MESITNSEERPIIYTDIANNINKLQTMANNGINCEEIDKLKDETMRQMELLSVVWGCMD